MPRGPNGEIRPTDANQLAKCIVDLATGAISEEDLKKQATQGDAAEAKDENNPVSRQNPNRYNRPPHIRP